MKCQKEPGYCQEPLTRSDKARIVVFIVLCIFSIAFWAAYEQAGNTLALWADKNTDRLVVGWEMPATWFQSLNPFFIFTLTPVITAFWAWQSRKGNEPGSMVKMGIGCLLLGASFLVMVPAAVANSSGLKVSMLWLVISILIMTLGELYLSPIGLSLVTKLAPPRMVSMIMGLWFLSNFAGNSLAGYIGSFWEVLSKMQFFLLLVGMSICAGIGILLYVYWLSTTEVGKKLKEQKV
jgi:POT family proton-dependent oligopeptide transporter